MKQCKGVIDATQDTIALVFQLGDATVLRSPKMIEKVIKDDKVWKAIESALKSHAKSLIDKQHKGQPVTSQDAGKFGQAVGTKAAQAAANSAKKQIEQSAEFRQLKHSLKELECAFKSSPIGVFVDENKGWLVVIAAGLAVGGATAMYVVRKGDFVASKLTSIAGDKLKFKFLGNVEAGVKGITFAPSDRKLDATAFAKAKWSKVEAEIGFQVAVQNDKLTSASGQGQVVVNVARGLKMTAKGKVGYTRPTETYMPPLGYDLSLGLSYLPGSRSSISVTAMAIALQNQRQQKFGGKASVNLNLRPGTAPTDPSVGLSFGAAANRVKTFGPQQNTATDLSINLGLVGKF